MSRRVIVRTASSSKVVLNSTNGTLSAGNTSFDSSATAANGVTADNVQDAIEQAVNQTASLTTDLGYTHMQPAPATTWTVNHNLTKYPAVQAFNDSLAEIDGEVTHINTNTLVIEFNVPVSGIATLN